MHNQNFSSKLGEVPEGRRGMFPPKVNQDYVCLRENGAPRVNQDFVCLLWGEGRAEVRVASTMTRSSVCAISSPNARGGG